MMKARCRVWSAIALMLAGAADASDRCVVLIHGLARSAASMAPMASALADAGFRVVNDGYPSRRHPIAELAAIAVPRGLAACGGRAHFVTHSLGGILVRAYAAEHANTGIGRVVMLAPPNQGSEVVDRMRRVPGFRLLNGPAGLQLGTDGVPARLGPVSFELGVIAGSRTFNPLLSQFLPNPDDGKVSVARTRVEGMGDFMVVPVAHPFIMGDNAVIEQAIHFLEHGRFDNEDGDA